MRRSDNFLMTALYKHIDERDEMLLKFPLAKRNYYGLCRTLSELECENVITGYEHVHIYNKLMQKAKHDGVYSKLGYWWPTTDRRARLKFVYSFITPYSRWDKIKDFITTVQMLRKGELR